MGAAALIAGGDYVTPQQRWLSALEASSWSRSRPATRLHPLYGSMTTRLFERLNIGLIDQTAWIGVVPLAHRPSARSKVGWHTDKVSRRWWPVAAFFLLWAAGPFLHVGGQGTGIVLPQFFIRFLPILENARIPGRAFVMVILAVAILCAIFVARQTLASRRDRAPDWVGTRRRPGDPLSALGGADLWTHRTTYGRRRAEGLGARTCRSGCRTASAQLGWFDSRSLVRQTYHQRPIVGGYHRTCARTDQGCLSGQTGHRGVDCALVESLRRILRPRCPTIWRRPSPPTASATSSSTGHSSRCRRGLSSNGEACGSCCRKARGSSTAPADRQAQKKGPAPGAGRRPF